MAQDGFPTMDGKNISVKAYLHGEGGDQEIRRFGLDSSAATSFSYLQGKLRVVFPSLTRQPFNVCWEDADGDEVTIGSDEELLVALVNLLQVGGHQTLRLYVVPSRPGRAEPPTDGPVHSGVYCDSCEQTIRGHRYKCMTCDDYDLCAGCEARCLHTEHLMLRIPTPDRVWQPVFRQAQRNSRRGQCPAAWAGMFGMPGAGGVHCGRSQRRAEKAEQRAEKRAERAEQKAEKRAERAGRCAEQAEKRTAQRDAAAGGRAAEPQPGNFFEAIHSAMSALGGFAPEGAAASGTAAGRWSEKSLEELGQTIAACLDPFGIDVDVGVETRQKRSEEANGEQRPAAGPASAQDIAAAATNAARAASAAAARAASAAAARAASAAAAVTANTLATAAAATAPTPGPAPTSTETPAQTESMEPEPAVADGLPIQMEPAAAEKAIAVTVEGLMNDPADDWTMVSGTSTPSEAASSGARSRVYPDLAAEAPPPPTAATPTPTPPTAATPIPTPPTAATPIPTPPTAATPIPTPPTAATPIPTPPTAATPTPTAPIAPAPSAPQPPEPVALLQPRVQRALDAMTAMGFSNDGGWLTNLLQAKNGDISAVLDVLQPVPRRDQ